MWRHAIVVVAWGLIIWAGAVTAETFSPGSVSGFLSDLRSF